MNTAPAGATAAAPPTPWKALEGDACRQFGRSGTLLIVKGFLTRRTFRPIVTLRLCQAAKRSSIGRPLLPLAKILHRFAAGVAGMDLPWDLDVDAGLALTHGWSLVISGGARIGRNVTLFHGVTLGRRDTVNDDGTRTTGFPVLEDEVWVGPHAVIVGGVTIGRGSRIAAGAFVTTDIPAHSMVVGNPSTIVKSGCRPDVWSPAP